MSALHLSLLFFYFYFLSVTALPNTSTKASFHGNQTDRLALLAFKAQITHDPQKVLDSWNNSLHFCMWSGVTCDHPHQRVVRLELISHGLEGTLSPCIGNLTFLNTIVLTHNSFHGQIPSEIGLLSRLEEFEVSNNSFVGEIPANLSHCSNIKMIGIRYNFLSGSVPEKLGSLSKLVKLYLNNNNLTGRLHHSFGNLSSLESLALGFNNFDGSIPESFGHLRSLKALGLNSNMLSSIVPPSLYNLSTLQIFSISYNQIHGSLPPRIGHTLPNLSLFLIGQNWFSGSIPTSLFNISTLQMLDINANGFTGQVPPTSGSLKDLEWLNLGYNHLGSSQTSDSRFLSSLINCTRLQTIIIESNDFNAILPSSIVNFSRQLNTLYLGGNQISGIIPSEIGNLVNLVAFDIYGNLLTGNIPMGIGKLSSLQELGLQENKLLGQIPPSLGNLSRLFFLDLSNNNLEGGITPSISNCRSLQRLDLSGNNLCGTVPNKVLSLLSQLLYLNLAHNSFIGTLPLDVGNLANLLELYVSNNKMTGTIPSTLGNCLSLKVLSLSSNFFQGSIPPLKYFKDIQTIDLSMNNFSVQIPLYLQNLSSLENLNLSFNSFEGDMPTKGIFQNASAFSILGNNNLCGGIHSLQLPPCPAKKLKQGRMSLALKLSLGVTLSAIAVLASSLFIILYCRKVPKKKSPRKHFWEDQFRRVSYHELHQATNGFASSSLISKGHFGTLYKGVICQDEEPVAVKVLNLTEKGASKSFIAECETLRKARHRNLIKILTICSGVDFQGNDFKALVLKFMPNGSLENWLHSSSNEGFSSRNLNLSQRINIAVDVASALDYLHKNCQMPIVHCDLKPSNILLDEEMTAYVGDFGLAKILSRNTSDSNQIEINSTSIIKGTIGYIPPEYGMNTEASTQGDVYSYGILLLEMFTGKRPTDGMFKDHLDLHSFSKKALSKQVVMEIIDPSLFLQKDNEAITNFEIEKGMRDQSVQRWLTALVRIGVACSKESPSDRIDIEDALKELDLIKRSFVVGPGAIGLDERVHVEV